MSATTTLRRSWARAASFSLLALLAAALVPAAAAAPAPQQLQFHATTLDGKPFNGLDYAGKPVVLWFWASWCPECMQEAQHVARAAAANPQVAFIGIAGKSRAPSEGEALAQIRSFVQKYGLGGITQVTDLRGEAFFRSNVTAIPTFVFLKPTGEASSLSDVVSEQALSERARQTLS
ncbi:TlpA family protein disulfide reductase [Segniliparus rugosus]|uniref:Thioredoxin domain-containing protein n=1 Tax=Segniliparus rugosus (strain ATCC BAA-974 / DSM 45345 / CCUG 50838 / CIP 108380 / JCM 13579 / CDC 945) TaxID=679197 RepID=E5XNA0_SEGRC|nr:TlpA disulfide reductase family protein [Segniliparus rugosus]EFV14196.1 hypothetical protein HMPREF9336_00970 [Segniliparus rugosus ATCC BAA-974]